MLKYKIYTKIYSIFNFTFENKTRRKMARLNSGFANNNEFI